MLQFIECLRPTKQFIREKAFNFVLLYDTKVPQIIKPRVFLINLLSFAFDFSMSENNFLRDTNELYT